MTTRTITADGREFHYTTVRIPFALYDLAKEHRVSMSATLTKALENRFTREGLQ
jgi:post-segregation antitoxin (ccd killing protein)